VANSDRLRRDRRLVVSHPSGFLGFHLVQKLHEPSRREMSGLGGRPHQLRASMTFINLLRHLARDCRSPGEVSWAHMRANSGKFFCDNLMMGKQPVHNAGLCSAVGPVAFEEPITPSVERPHEARCCN
jgi:hypothetical protein